MPRLRILAGPGLFLIFLFLLTGPGARGAAVEYDLTVARQELNLTGKPAWAMTLNGGVPGPVLRFTEGDLARIRVHNRMEVGTSIHWHGLLVPPRMDGVPLVSFPPIGPGETFTYEFPIRQSGTYWYHSHTGLQEQSGLYGAIVIEPREKGPGPGRDHVVVLSDWTDEDPRRVLRTLKRGSEWYALRKGSGQSLLGAARLGMAGSYFRRELQRMPPMDISDVAYDLFLANGKPQISLAAAPGETVRVRLVNGSSTTFFHLEFAGGPMTLAAADGPAVEPFPQGRFLMAVAETYDLLVKVPAAGSYELRATAHDGSGFASIWVGSGMRHPAPPVPRPNLYHSMGGLSLKTLLALTPAGAMGMADHEVQAGKFDQPGGMTMGPMKMDGTAPPQGGSHTPAHMGSHGSSPPGPADLHAPSMGAPPPAAPQAQGSKRKWGLLADDVAGSPDLAVDGMDPRRPGTPYARLRSTKPTAFAPGRPVREIRLTLDGDMERYVWLLNNRALSESDSILVREGEVLRLIMINRTMMHHPMHLHGHFFRVLNGQGEHSPLKHTVDVAPMSTTVIEFAGDEPGDWFFHCHLLYHMKSGMARVVHYQGSPLPPDLAALRPRLYREDVYFQGRAEVLSNMATGFLSLSTTRNLLTAEWEAGWQGVEETEWEAAVTLERYFHRFFSLFAGAHFEGERDRLEHTRAVLGLRYLLPLNLHARLWVDSDRGARFNLGKGLALTPRLTLFGEAQYDTRDLWEGRIGLSYTLHRDFSLVAQWHSDYGPGAGLQIRF